MDYYDRTKYPECFSVPQIILEAIERLSTYVPVSETDSYAEGYRDGLAQARKVLGEMLVE